MACSCIDRVNEHLRPKNTRLALTILFHPPVDAVPTIVTEQIEKGRGKTRASVVIPSHCPFCGTRYEAA